MKIRWHGMNGLQHSWSYVSQQYARAMKKFGHEVYIKSTNSLEHFPDDLRENLLPGYHSSLTQGPADYITEDGRQIVVDPKTPLPEIQDKGRPYDLELAYSILFQAPRRFYPETKARALIWNFESSILPPGWHLYHKSLDYIFPSSQFSYDIFAANGIPKYKMVVVPHGVDTNEFNPDIPPFPLKTEKKIKFLSVARPHARKCHDRMIKGYLDAFTGNDDVCLVLKTSLKKPDKDKLFEVDIEQILTDLYKGRKNPPEIEIVDDYIPHIGSIYTACDVHICMSSTEGFDLPLLETLACEKLVLAPRYGGQLEFLNDENSLLINTKEMLAPASHQYWISDKRAVVGDPDINDYKDKLRYLYENLEQEKDRVKEATKRTVEKFNWEDQTKIILDLPIPTKSRYIPEKRRVLYIVPYNVYGGGEVWVEQTIKNLDKTRYEPEVAFLMGAPEQMVNNLKKMNISFADMSLETNPPTPKEKGNYAIQALKCFIESGAYSVVHFYNSFGVYNILRQCRHHGLRSIIIETVHSDLKWNDSMTKVSKRDIVTAIVAVSNNQAQRLLKLGNKNVIVMPQQVDWDKFTEKRNRDILKEFDIPNDKFIVGFVGRLSSEKNIPIILQCANIMPDVQFVLIGGGPLQTPLKQMSANLPNFHLIGQRTDIERFYPAFDALILPSLVEGLPLVILESMASGTPVIASDIGAVSEIISDGLNGFTIWNPSDPMLFAAAINRLMGDVELWNRCSLHSKEIVNTMKSKYENINITSLYDQIWEALDKR